MKTKTNDFTNFRKNIKWYFIHVSPKNTHVQDVLI